MFTRLIVIVLQYVQILNHVRFGKTAFTCSFPSETAPGGRQPGPGDKEPFLTYKGLRCLAPSYMAKETAAAAGEGNSVLYRRATTWK